MSERYIEREKANLTNLEPRSAKQKDLVERIIKLLDRYTMSRHDAPVIKELALQIWRETRR